VFHAQGAYGLSYRDPSGNAIFYLGVRVQDIANSFISKKAQDIANRF